MTDWTPEQWAAINDRHHNLLVAAAAGAGKTAVLVERIMSLMLTQEVSIDRMLIVTFTQAAAGEMRSRISARLLAEIEQAPGRQEYLEQQLSLLGQATICTLHAFCMEIVKRFFYLLDIDPRFRIGDETECGLIKAEVLEELLEAEYAAHNGDFLELVDMFGGGRDDRLLGDLVQRIHGFIQSQPDPLDWLKIQVQHFDLAQVDPDCTLWIQELRTHLQTELEGIAAIFREALEIAGEPGGPSQYQAALTRDIHGVQSLQSQLSGGIEAFYQELSLLQFTRLGAATKEVDPILRDEAKSLREQGKKLLQDIVQDIFFQSPAALLRDLQDMQVAMQCLYRLLEGFTRIYRHHKDERGILDFNDLEHMALRALADDGAAAEYRAKFEYIFVDEYQDSNLVQETILNRIRRETNLFLVGDVKQSIYRFRLADPELFLAKHAAYGGSENSTHRRIDLNTNFRSRPEIVAGINQIFSQIMTAELGEIDYREEGELLAGVSIPGDEATQEGPPALELLLIDQNRADPSGEHQGEDDLLEDLADMDVEARRAAARINELHGQSFFDHRQGRTRSLEYRDIVVLMRATRSQAQVFADNLTAAGIPVYADVDRGYFKALEVNIFLNLLRLIDNRRQDIPLLSVMRSPIGRFSLDDLIAIRAASGPGSFFAAMEGYTLNHQDDLALRLRSFISQLDRFRQEARIVDLDEFIWNMMRETGYYYYVGAMPGGGQRQANLRLLVERAGQYQAGKLTGLFHFLRFVDNLQSVSGDLGMAKLLGAGENVVRIMSIHKSKGLEFPVVLLAGLGRGFNTRDSNDQILLHKKIGLGPRYADAHLRVARETLARIAIKNALKKESLAEEMRILYVACTRAQDRLILLGSVKDLDRGLRKWSRPVSAFQLSRGRCYLDWIVPVIMRHQDGAPLRAKLGWEIELIEQRRPHRWRVQTTGREITPGSAPGREIRPGSLLLPGQPQQGPGRFQTAVWSRLNWQYPFPEASRIPSKLAVSQVKELREGGLISLLKGREELNSAPEFMKEGTAGLSGAARGSLMHLVMQHLDLSKISTQPDIEAQLQDMAGRQILRREEIGVIDTARIRNFFTSPLGRRLLQAEHFWREVPFNLVFAASRVIPGVGSTPEELLLQGIIDLYFVEAGELVLVDYKTDRVTPGHIQEIVDRYRVQIEIYQEALEKIQNRRVKECYIYLFDAETAVKLTK